MRMWMVDPRYLCRQHLLGEHKELHMLVGTLNRKISIAGYLKNGLVEVHSIRSRHERLVREMKSRGYNHQSPLKEFQDFEAGIVNVNESMNELYKRCPACRGRMEEI